MSDYNDNKIFNKRLVFLFIFKYLRLFIFAFLLLLFILSFLFIINPKYSKMKNTSNTLKEEKGAQIESLDQYLSRLMVFNRSLNSIKSSETSMDGLNKIIPNQNETEDLIIVIDSIVKNRKLSLISVGINEDVDKTENTRTRKTENNKEDDLFSEKVKKINFELSVEGVDYNSMKALVSDFEKSLRFFDISEINFIDGQNNMTLKLSSYYFQS